MLRVAPLRTGVEVLGSETMWFVPVDPTFSQELPPSFMPLGTSGEFGHPAMWIHELLDLGQTTVIGYLILSPGDPGSLALFQQTQVALDPLGPPGVDAVYKGIRPGEEHWIWFDDPWPSDFVLRGREYPTRLPSSLFEEPRFAYPIDQFDPRGDLLPLEGVHEYEIRTDPSAGPVGYLSIDDADAQRWLADPRGLYQRLIPPFKDGTWRFEARSSSPSASFVPLSRGTLNAIDLSGRN